MRGALLCGLALMFVGCGRATRSELGNTAPSGGTRGDADPGTPFEANAGASGSTQGTGGRTGDTPNQEAGSSSGRASAGDASFPPPEGGADSAGGSAASTGGADDPIGGARTSESGAGGSLSCADYLACGCGCCAAASALTTRCYYPDVAGDLDTILAEDERLRQDCSTAGCSSGVNYRCCVSTSVATNSTHSVAPRIGALDRIEITKTTGATCARLVLVAPAPAEPRLRTALEVPEGWGLERGSLGPCLESTEDPAETPAIGAEGWIAWSAPSDECRLDLHFTAFFAGDSLLSELSAIPFDAGELVLGGVSWCR